MTIKQNAFTTDIWPTIDRLSYSPPTIASLFNQEPNRSEHCSLSLGPLFLDYSKNHISQELFEALVTLAAEVGLPSAISDLISGQPVNNTEQRPALHTGLRCPALTPADNNTVVAATREKMTAFVQQLHDGHWHGFTGKAITDVVNIGIGGSDLGPRMIVTAINDRPSNAPNVHFVANIDGADLSDTLAALNPETTLFIIASKSFSTLETRENALAARSWMEASSCSANQLAQHFVAVSSNIPAAVEFGISEDNIFPMWDWVGGRYSLWSAIGLPIAIALGNEHFDQLLQGAAAMDRHFSEAPIAENMPIVMALMTFWYSATQNYQSQAILPYAQRLNRLPAYLQQLDMESLGKSVDRQGSPLACDSGLVLWGTEGTNGQHSFHQLLHQGTRKVLVDFIATAKAMSRLSSHHQYLLANCIGQAQALLAGKSLEQATQELIDEGMSEAQANALAPHKVIPGNRPSNMLLLDELTPYSLGSLVALYEHKVYCLGVLWGLNPFDQWGVELGKQLGTAVHSAMEQGACPDSWDESTRALIDRLKGN